MDTVSARRGALPGAADVVVVGGGVIGLSTAFHIAQAGASVVLLERDELGSGSTSKAAGGLRAQFSDALNVALAQRSLRAYREFTQRLEWEIDFHEMGYLFVLEHEQHVATFERSIEMQNTQGVPSRLVTPEEAVELSPLLQIDGILAAAYSHEDAHASPEGIVQGYAAAARRHGAHLRTRCTVEDISVVDGSIREVVTSAGPIRTNTVVCAAGAWSAACGAMAGVSLPVTPERRDILFTEPIPGLPEHFPLTVDFATGLYFHREGPGLLMGIPDPAGTPGFSSAASDEWVPHLLEVAQRRVPAIASAGIRGGWSGLYEMSPDHNAIIGEAASVSRFLYATGFSGHGLLQAPAVGELLRDLVLGQPSFIDASPLSAERFDGRALEGEFNFI